MKKPHSLYLSALAHNRLSTYVDNALDGAGSLSGFFAFIEERALALVERTGDIPSEADMKLTALANLDSRSLRQPLTTYSQTWSEFAAAVPWSAADPAGTHLLAMQLLNEFPLLWEAEYKQRLRQRHSWDRPRYVNETIERIRDPDVSAAQVPDPAGHGWPQARPIFGRDRIDFIVTDRQVPVSVYLDTKAHRLFYTAFGNRFFTRLEHALIYLLEDPYAARNIEVGALFLELGPEAIDTDELHRAAHEIQRAVAALEPSSLSRRSSASDAQLAKLARKAGYTSLEDPSLLSDGLDRNYVRRRDAKTQGHYSWPPTLVADESTLVTLHLGDRLGLIDGTDIRHLPYRIVVALSEEFGITEISPTRDNALRLMGYGSAPYDETVPFDNAVDLHMWELFTIYARHCLPNIPPKHTRIHQRVLATLAENDLFPRVAAIEAFTGTTARKAPSGMWQLRRGRKIHTELDHRTFLRVGERLRSLIPLRDPVTGSEHGRSQDPATVRIPEPYSYTVGIEVIDRTLRILASHGEATAHRALDEELRQDAPMLSRTGSPDTTKVDT